MPDPQKISLVTIIAGLVIVLSLFVLVIFSPFVWMISSGAFGFLHQPHPDAICLYPPADETTMDAVWSAIVNRSGIDPSSAAFQELEVRILPDETLEELRLSFYATRAGEGSRYEAYLRYDPKSCGTLTVRANPSDPPEYATSDSRSPQEILLELPSVRPSVFGISNQSVRITTALSREMNATYYSLPCTNLFLLENGTILPLERIVLHDTRPEAGHWSLFIQRCVTVPPDQSENCVSNGVVLIFSGERLQSADLLLNASASREITVQECPHGPTQGQSCESTFWGGTRCVNWTVE